jgi:hypothetical protein
MFLRKFGDFGPVPARIRGGYIYLVVNFVLKPSWVELLSCSMVVFRFLVGEVLCTQTSLHAFGQRT